MHRDTLSQNSVVFFKCWKPQRSAQSGLSTSNLKHVDSFKEKDQSFQTDNGKNLNYTDSSKKPLMVCYHLDPPDKHMELLVIKNH